MSRMTANLLLLLTAVIWGASFAAQKLGAGHVGTLTFTTARFFLGSFVVLPLAWREAKRLGISNRHLFGMVITGAVLFCGSSLQQLGVSETSVTNAGFITGLYVPLVPILEFAFLKVRPHPVIWPAAVLSLFGTWLLSGGESLSFSKGDLWVFLGAFFWAWHVILVGRVSMRSNAPTVLACVQFAVAGVIAAILCPLIESQPFAGIGDALPEIAYVGIMSVGVGFTLQSVTQRFTPAADAAIILAGETVFSAVGGVLVMGESLTPIKLAGCAAILAAMLVVQLVPQSVAAQPVNEAA